MFNKWYQGLTPKGAYSAALHLPGNLDDISLCGRAQITGGYVVFMPGDYPVTVVRCKRCERLNK